MPILKPPTNTPATRAYHTPRRNTSLVFHGENLDLWLVDTTPTTCSDLGMTTYRLLHAAPGHGWYVVEASRNMQRTVSGPHTSRADALRKASELGAILIRGTA